MTVVSALKFDKKNGAGACDERETHFGARGFDITQKISQLGTKSLVGYSGVVPYGELAIQTARDYHTQLKDDSDFRESVRGLESGYQFVRRKSFVEGLLAKYNIPEQAYIEGKVPQPVMEQILRAVNEPRAFDLTMLTAGYNPKRDDFEIFIVAYPGLAHFDPKYQTIGSGSDRADLVIGDKLNELKPDLRVKIPKHVGVKILVEATQSARLNVGVGGTGQIVLVDDVSGYHELGRPETNMLYNSVYLQRLGEFEKEFVDNVFRKVVDEQNKGAELLPEIEKRLGSKRLYEIFFLEGLHQ